MGADERAGAGAEGADDFRGKEPEPKIWKLGSRSRRFEKQGAGADAKNLKSNN